jgi:hypothetical protein
VNTRGRHEEEEKWIRIEEEKKRGSKRKRAEDKRSEEKKIEKLREKLSSSSVHLCLFFLLSGNELLLRWRLLRRV